MGVRGIGLDLVELVAFEQQLRAPGSVFTAQTFTAAEQSAAGGSSGRAAHLGARFAAKEAFVKAFSSALPGRAPVIGDLDWRHIEVASDDWGRPRLMLHGAVAAAVGRWLGEVRVLVSLTHEPGVAGALVLIEDAP